ncbi:MAG: hypothetical protein ACLTMP_14905 [Eggerthella lenta]
MIAEGGASIRRLRAPGEALQGGESVTPTCVVVSGIAGRRLALDAHAP